MSISQEKCKVGIMREARVGGGGSAFTVYVDGVKTTTIKNGESTRLLLSTGKHVIGFGGIRGKILGGISLNLAPDEPANIVCYTKGSGIEASLTSVDVCALAGRPPQARSNRVGAPAKIFGLILFLLGLYIIGFRLKLFFYLIPSN